MKRIVKDILKRPFRWMRTIGMKFQIWSFNAINYIEFEEWKK